MDVDKGATKMSRREELDKMLEFSRTAERAVKDTPVAFFECPCCGGIAYAERSIVSGKVVADCDSCGTVVMR